jgi:hypothetical protein
MSERRINQNFIHAALFVLALAVTFIFPNSASAAPSAADYVESCRLGQTALNPAFNLALGQNPELGIKVFRAIEVCRNITQGVIDTMRFVPPDPSRPCKNLGAGDNKFMMCDDEAISCFKDGAIYKVQDDGYMLDDRFADAVENWVVERVDQMGIGMLNGAFESPDSLITKAIRGKMPRCLR